MSVSVPQWFADIRDNSSFLALLGSEYPGAALLPQGEDVVVALGSQSSSQPCPS